MCELFGVSASEKILVNDLLREFYSHSGEHPNGWGLAIFYGDAVSLEREPIRADRSAYLRERLRHRIEVRDMIAHIRLATIGSMEYENCHPFVKRDCFGRSWTLAHNGTIFDYPALSPYLYQQEGRTDSERILCYLVDQLDRRQGELGRPLDPEERFALVDRLIRDMAPGNKLNLLLYDGERMYVHTNYANSLHMHQQGEGTIFSTVPLDRSRWDLVPFNTLCAFEKGALVLQGEPHDGEYLDNEKDMQYIFTDFAGL